MMLVPEPPDADGRGKIERLVTFSGTSGSKWSQRPHRRECVQESTADVSVMTTLLEARHWLEAPRSLLACATPSLPTTSGRSKSFRSQGA